MRMLRECLCLLCWGLALLLMGCGPVRLVDRPAPTPTPLQMARSTPLPLAIAQAAEEELYLEVEPSPLPSPPPPAPAPPRPRLEPPPPPPVRVPPPPPPPPVAEDPPVPLALAAPSYPEARPPASALEKAEAASLALDEWIQSGQLRASFHGTGDLQDMIHFRLVNTSNRPMRVQLTPGMILNPGPQQRVQPLLVTEQAELVLQPGESRAGNLQSFCMDSRVPAPLPGQPVDYRFSTRTEDGGPQAVRAHQAAERLVKSSPYRHAITQIAIWKSLGQPVDEKHLRSVLGPLARDPQVRREVLQQVDRVLKSL